uniref:Uncharacterized protein n=1 Tax=Tanacetum cinerariifolium TaxID=118510 RepID=A0A699HK41_TANCI|nr:hypothetical protein [Tanacetum cinerariifolium]
MLNPNPDTSIDSVLNLNTESTSLVDVPITTNVEMPSSSVTTPPPPPVPLIQPQHQTPVLPPETVPNRLREEAQAKNEDFINKLDENIKKIIKEQVKVHIKEQVSKILPRIKNNLARKEDTRDLFNELMDTPLDFSAFVMNQLKVDTLTPELLAGLTFELMKGLYKSLVELEYFLEEVYKATIDQLD